MTAQQLSAALDAVVAEANGERFSKRQFCRLTGTNYARMDRMLAGEEGADIPHIVTVLLAILASPEIGPRPWRSP
jgi:hypothetical protein